MTRGTLTAYMEDVARLTVERDEARAEVERQTAELDDLDTKLGGALRAIGLEHAENERLRADYERMWSALQAETTTSVQVRGELRAEVERLRATLTKIQQWDSLNPPAPRTDFPWLKRLVDEALGTQKAGSAATNRCNCNHAALLHYIDKGRPAMGCNECMCLGFVMRQEPLDSGKAD